MPDPVICLDDGQRILLLNHKAAYLFGYAEGEALGRGLGDLLRVDGEEWLVELLRTGDERRELLGMRKNGETFPVEIAVSQVAASDSRVYLATLRDISRRKRAEEVLRQSELRYRGLVESQMDMLVRVDPEGKFIFVNQVYCDTFGKKPSDLLGKSFTPLVHPDDLPGTLEQMRKLFRPPYRMTVEQRAMTVNGWRWLLWEDSTILDENGRVLEIQGIGRDITERRVMEEKLRYRLSLESLLGRISTRFINLASEDVDQEINLSLAAIGEFENVDRSYVFFFDLERETMANTHEWCQPGIEPQIDVLKDLPFSVFPWWMARLERRESIVVRRLEDLPPEAAAEKEILQAQDIQSLVVIPLWVSNRLIGFVGFDSISASKDWDEDTVPLLQRYVDQLAGLLERKRVETALRRSEERNTAILSAIPDNMFRLDSHGVIVDYIASDPASLLLPAGHVRGTAIHEVLGRDQARDVLDKVQEALDTGQRQTVEYQAMLRGQREYFEARLVAIDENEVIAIVRNVSERARLEQMKTDFINRATHDLRTPMTTIMLMVQMLEDECTPDERQEYWSILKEELQREKGLIDNLLTVSKLEHNQYNLRVELVNPFERLRRSIKTLAPPAAHKNLALAYHLPDEEFSVYADANTLEEIFTNLIFNAVKFTPPRGRIEISAYRDGQKGCFRIQDSGIGIAAEDLPNLFTRFFRGRNAIEYDIPGSGIGLFIAKSMIETFGGQIQVESVLGQGTTFEFWLPVASSD